MFKPEEYNVFAFESYKAAKIGPYIKDQTSLKYLPTITCHPLVPEVPLVAFSQSSICFFIWQAMSLKYLSSPSCCISILIMEFFIYINLSMKLTVCIAACLHNFGKSILRHVLEGYARLNSIEILILLLRYLRHSNILF